MQIYHNSQSTDCRVPLGAVTCGTDVSLKVFITGDAAQVWLRGWDNSEYLSEAKEVEPGVYEAHVTMPQSPALWWYYFVVRDSTGVIRYLGNAQDGLGAEGVVYGYPPPSFQITVFSPKFYPPRFLRDGVMYQIFPDRFARSGDIRTCIGEGKKYHESWDEDPDIDPDPRSGDNRALDFFGGNLQGITSRMDYLASLGITILYLNPIFQARSNHRYDTGDYSLIDPLLGSEQDLAALCKTAEEYGIRVILDGVFSHTGEDSRYFNKYGHYDSTGAYQSQASNFYKWYKFFKFPDEYKCWWNIPTLPELNKYEPTYRKFVNGNHGIAQKWLRKGASGWRLDVADELPMEFLREFRQSVKTEKPEAAIIGEVWEDASHKVTYGELRSYCFGDTLDSVMNYPLRDAAISFLTGKTDAYAFTRIVKSQQENYPVPFYYSLMNLTGSHDRARILNVLCGQEYNDTPWKERGRMKLSSDMRALAINRLEKLISIYVALPGFPCIYYGDEIGMEGAADPFCRRTFNWASRDASIENIIKSAIGLRRSRPVLRTGEMEIGAMDKHTIMIRRHFISGADVFGEQHPEDEYRVKVTNV